MLEVLGAQRSSLEIGRLVVIVKIGRLTVAVKVLRLA
jgi:hypothetical protein